MPVLDCILMDYMDAAAIWVCTSTQAQEELHSFGIHILHQRQVSLVLQGRKGSRTSSQVLALDMEGLGGLFDSSWQKSVTSLEVSHYVNEIRQD